MDLKEEFIKNLKIAGGEIFDTPPKGWWTTKGEFAVATNGAVWVKNYTKELFLSENVLLQIPSVIYPDMQTAINQIDSPGVFISGPSKTADVESFLVFGAHGPIRLGVMFI